MNRRTRIVIIGASTLAVVAVSIGVFLTARGAYQEQSTLGPTTSADPAAVLAVPHVTFRNAELGSQYSVLAAVPLSDLTGPRAYFGITCERTSSNRVAGACLHSDRGVVTSYQLLMLDANLHQTSAQPLAGTPSRTRLSADGSLVATTTFVTGHSYADTAFSTELIIRRDGQSLGNLEEWSATVDGQPLLAASRNFWGGTFAADDDTFYVTAAVGSTTWLMKGSISKRTLTSLRTDAECPALSPDGTKLGYKKRLGNASPGVWRLAVLDLTTNTETLLAETRSVDDQVEWLDDDHILYQVPRSGSDATITDIWSVPADGTGKPEVFLAEASSPAVVR
jgi:hypothetical protein